MDKKKELNYKVSLSKNKEKNQYLLTSAKHYSRCLLRGGKNT